MKLIASPEQIRAARAMLGWSQQELASKSKVGRTTIFRIERGEDDSNNASRAKLQSMLEEHGIEFLPPDGNRGEGIRLTALK
jgi:ribosome-binding protein aMBF1 (putative translation factor)